MNNLTGRCTAIDIGRTATTGTDERNIQLVTRRILTEETARDDIERSCCSGSSEESTT